MKFQAGDAVLYLGYETSGHQATSVFVTKPVTADDYEYYSPEVERYFISRVNVFDPTDEDPWFAMAESLVSDTPENRAASASRVAVRRAEIAANGPVRRVRMLELNKIIGQAEGELRDLRIEEEWERRNYR